VGLSLKEHRQVGYAFVLYFVSDKFNLRDEDQS